MKWFQLDSDFLDDPRVVQLAMKYKAAGIGVYIATVSRISKNFKPGNPTLELEESTPLLSRILGETPGDQVDAILKYCEDLGLFHRGPNNRVRCRTLLRKMDTFTSRNEQLKQMRAEAEAFDKDFEQTSKSLRAPTNLPYQSTDQLTLEVERRQGEILKEIESIEKNLKNDFFKGMAGDVLKEKLLLLTRELTELKSDLERAKTA